VNIKATKTAVPIRFFSTISFNFDSKVDIFSGQKNTKKVQPDKMRGEPVFYKLEVFWMEVRRWKFEVSDPPAK
jgi:hypothetical protein